MQNELLISFVVAIYKVENELPACLDSMICQKDERVEFILVEDGSPDRCGEICDAYARKDERIRVIHQQNAGVSVARNRGIEAACGKWIFFVDGDDMLAPDAVSVLTRTAQDDPSDVVYFCHVRYPDRENIPPFTPEAPETWFRTAEELKQYREMVARDRIHEQISAYSPWAKLIRRDFLRRCGVGFVPGLTRAQDCIFALQMVHHVTLAHVVPKCVYWYYYNEDGVTHRFKPEIIAINTRYLRYNYEELEKMDIEHKEEIWLRRCYLNVIVALNSGAYHPDCHWGIRKRRQWLDQLREQFWARDFFEKMPMEQIRKRHMVNITKLARSGRWNRVDLYCLWNFRIKLRLKRIGWMDRLNDVIRG